MYESISVLQKYAYPQKKINRHEECIHLQLIQSGYALYEIMSFIPS